MKRYLLAGIAVIFFLSAAYIYHYHPDWFRQISTQSSDLLPPPLRSALDGSNAYLTNAGVITFTNQQRADNGNLPPLHENAKLDAAAQTKLQDMFARQYFEHISPTGKGPSDLANQVGYKYILIGENLALGNFKDDEALVVAWMNSPGHRANILNNRYQEIGVAVGKGTFEGHETWLAVQEFGTPLSSCPQPSGTLKQEIDSNQGAINQSQADLAARKADLDNGHYDRATYNQKVDEYNTAVNELNALINATKQLVNEYNTQISQFNNCLAG